VTVVIALGKVSRIPEFFTVDGVPTSPSAWGQSNDLRAADYVPPPVSLRGQQRWTTAAGHPSLIAVLSVPLPEPAGVVDIDAGQLGVVLERWTPKPGAPRKNRVRANVSLSPQVIAWLDAVAEIRACSRADVAEDFLRQARDGSEHGVHQLPDFSVTV
jgi:hypothetical protein